MKRIIIITFSVLFIFINSTNVVASNTIPIYVNGNVLTPDVNPYIANSRTFVPIRFIGEALNASSIQWNNKSKVATLIFNDTTIKLPIGSNTITVNNNNYKIDAPISLKSGRTFVPVRFISEILGYNVQWLNSSVYINSSDYPPKNYTSEDLHWLSRIVEAEASAEPYSGKLAVANVIINRKKSSDFPNSIKGVIFDNNYGIQFSPVANGTIYNTPSTESIKAATSALTGSNNIGYCLYFLNPNKSTNFWIMNNRSFYIKINNHSFYS